VLTVVGARPQFVKAAVVARALSAHGGFEEYLLHTGQHYDTQLSDVFFHELDLQPPHFHLGVGSGTHGVQTARMLAGIEQVLQRLRPDLVIVYGDTNSTLAGALAATKGGIRCAHVEAGLRSFNRCMPEELNRVATDHLADLLFAPNCGAIKNLAKEGITGDRCHNVGDVMYDAALVFGRRADAGSDIVERLDLKCGEYILATVHRAGNTDDITRLRTILDALRLVGKRRRVVFPIHPRTRARLDVAGHDFENETISFIDPVGYRDMQRLERHACVIATDSGGVQKEAFFHRVPCVILRRETEWPELVTLGWSALVEPTNATVVADVLTNHIGVKGRTANPYGDGTAGEKIAALLAAILGAAEARRTEVVSRSL